MGLWGGQFPPRKRAGCKKPVLGGSYLGVGYPSLVWRPHMRTTWARRRRQGQGGGPGSLVPICPSFPRGHPRPETLGRKKPGSVTAGIVASALSLLRR